MSNNELVRAIQYGFVDQVVSILDQHPELAQQKEDYVRVYPRVR